MFTISYWFQGTNHEAGATFQSQAKAIKAAKVLAERFGEVTVWAGRPGEQRLTTVGA